jgi:hypothetical protein
MVFSFILLSFPGFGFLTQKTAVACAAIAVFCVFENNGFGCGRVSAGGSHGVENRPLAAHYLKYGFILSYFDGAVNLQIRRECVRVSNS